MCKFFGRKFILIVIVMFFGECFSAGSNEFENLSGVVTVFGFRSAQDISDEIRFHIVSMKYKFHLKKITPPSDAVTVKVSIDKYGNVSNEEILSPDTLSDKTKQIILQDLSGWKFVQIHENGKTIASFPLRLKNRLEDK